MFTFMSTKYKNSETCQAISIYLPMIYIYKGVDFEEYIYSNIPFDIFEVFTLKVLPHIPWLSMLCRCKRIIPLNIKKTPQNKVHQMYSLLC